MKIGQPYHNLQTNKRTDSQTYLVSSLRKEIWMHFYLINSSSLKSIVQNLISVLKPLDYDNSSREVLYERKMKLNSLYPSQDLILQTKLPKTTLGLR